MHCQQHLCQEFSSVSAARTFLIEELGGTRYARAFPRYQKDSFSIMINMHISTFLAFVHTYVIGTSDRFKEVLVKFQNAKDTLSRILPPGAPDGRVNHRNNLYFACERIEAIFIRAMIKTLYVEDAPPESILIIHDGIWIYPPPGEVTLANAVAYANNKIGMNLNVKVTPLVQEHNELITQLGIGPSATISEHSYLAHLDSLTRHDWWHHLHLQPPRLPAAVKKQIFASNSRSVAEEADALFRYFTRLDARQVQRGRASSV
jgi:hypothetical protein